MIKARHLRHPVRAAHAAEQLVRSHLSALSRAREGKRVYRNDPRWQLDAVERGLRPQADPRACDEDLLRRICAAYKAATRAPCPDVYRPTEWWEGFRRAGLLRVIRALETGDLDALQSMYANFFRDRCSDGLVRKPLLLDASVNRTLKKTYQSSFLSEALLRLDTWKRLTNGRYNLDVLSAPPIGNPFGIVLGGVLVRADAVHQHYCAHRVGSILGHNDGVVAEIGGGYGGMAYYLLRDSPNTTYLNFDVPESLALAAFYLMRSFPEKRVLLCGETRGKHVPIEDFDIVLLPVADISMLLSECADLTFSAHVISDLAPEAFSRYMKEVSRVTKRHFLYEGMYPGANGIQNKILSECRDFALREEKRFPFFGSNDHSDLQWELLYERN